MRALSILLLFALLAMVCPLAAAEKEVSDDQLFDQVRLRLAADSEVGRSAIDVQVEKAVVTLRGKVHTQKSKNKAERLTKKVKGVKRVVNELTVAP